MMQVSIWMTSGRRLLDDEVYKGIIEEYLASDARKNGLSRLEYIAVFLGNEESLSGSTRKYSSKSLHGAGIEMVSPNMSFAGFEKGSCAGIRLETQLNNPLLGKVAVAYSNENPLAFHFGFSEFRIYVLGKWFRVARTDLWES